jgi:regulator of replication initiation timing
MGTSKKPSGQQRTGAGKKNSSSDNTALKARVMELTDKNDVLVTNNKQLLDSNNQLRMDKAELQSKLEMEQKRKGVSIGTESDQLKLEATMETSVKNLVQQSFFLRWPFLDKTKFHQGNLMAPAIKHLRIAEEDSRKYEVDLRRVCIAKTTYWRGYCADQVKKEYISKYNCDCFSYLLAY